jgi:hypothetical protein
VPTSAEHNVDVVIDDAGDYHFVVYLPGAKNARAQGLTLCGKDRRKGMGPRAWFRVGDKRGAVQFARACETCREKLSI